MKKRLVVFVFLTISLALLSSSKILVIESYSSDYSWDSGYIAALKDIIYEGNEILFFEMNTKNLPASEHGKMVEKAYEKFLDVNPDIVVLGDDFALKMLGPKIVSWGLPVVYIGINNNPRNYFEKFPCNLTGVLERPLFKRSLVFVKEFIPDAKNVLILFDKDITSEIVKKEYFYDKDSIRIEGMNVDVVLVDTFENWKDIISDSKNKYDFMILGLYQTIRDEKGNIVDMNDVLRWTSENTPVPIFSFWDFGVGKDKAIGGYVLSSREMGEVAGKLINRILDGESIESIGHVYDEEGIFLFSKSQLEKWNFELTDRALDKVEYTE